MQYTQFHRIPAYLQFISSRTCSIPIKKERLVRVFLFLYTIYASFFFMSTNAEAIITPITPTALVSEPLQLNPTPTGAESICEESSSGITQGGSTTSSDESSDEDESTGSLNAGILSVFVAVHFPFVQV
jgi:hypothetical protein